jgi:hypothetical protein
MPDPLPIAPRLMNVMGKAYQGVKNRLYRNLSPYGYEADQYNPKTKKMETVGPVSRLYKAIIKNQPEEERLDMEKNPQGFDREKLDLYGMYLGKGQKYNTIKQSEYKPSIGSGKGTYYSVPKLEESINVSEVKAKDFSDFKNQVLSIAEKGGIGGNNIVGKKGDNSAILNMQPLGDAKISTGEDEKGYYISYYDKWDINPFSGGSKVNSSLASALGIDKKEDISGADGPEIYGRIYFDKKTGKRKK